jgi:hypothetical protein
VEHGQLVTKGENLGLQGGKGPKTGGEESEKRNQNRVHRGCNHHLTNDGNLCVFKSVGVFGTHSCLGEASNALATPEIRPQRP